MSDIPSPSMGIATNDPKNIHDMTAFVQQSLTDMQNKFTNMSDQVRENFNHTEVKYLRGNRI